MNVSEYFEQFVGDTRYFNPYRDSRIEDMLKEGGLYYSTDGQISYTQDGRDRYHIASKILSCEDMISRLKALPAKYSVYDIKVEKTAEWNKGTYFVSFMCGAFFRVRGEYD